MEIITTLNYKVVIPKYWSQRKLIIDLKGSENMKNQTHSKWLWQSLVIAALFATFGLNTAHAESPFHASDFVSISKLDGLEVQINEVTYSQYSVLKALLPEANQTPWKKKCFLQTVDFRGFLPNHPAGCISFDDAEAYIRVLNTQDSKYTYRLPTENELKKLVDMTLDAMRFNRDLSYEILSESVWHYDNSDYRDHEVCTKRPIFGLCDIVGNLFEWTSTQVQGSSRTIGGCSWYNPPSIVAKCGSRMTSGDHDMHHGLVGFRLIRTRKYP